MKFDTVILDLDGTLVDSVYQHVLAWQQAFTDVGLRVRSVDLHGVIGMGGDRLVAHVAGDAAEWAVGDRIRTAHDEHFRGLLATVNEFEGASDLLEELGTRHRVVLATSGGEEITQELLSRVPGAHVLSAIVTGSDVELSKPAPDVLLAAAQRVDAEHPVVIGDAVWDAHAAQAAGFPCIGFTSGGVSANTLGDAGAAWVHDGPRGFLASLEHGPLGP